MIPLPKLEIYQEVTFLSFKELHKRQPYRSQYTYGGEELPGIKGIITFIAYDNEYNHYKVNVRFLKKDYDMLYPNGMLTYSKYANYNMQEDEFQEYYD